MSLSRNQKCRIIIVLAMCVLLAVLFIWQPVSFAWLSSAMRSSTFGVKSSSVSTMTAEMWANYYVEYSNKTVGWYVESIDAANSDETNKKFSSIGTFGKSNDPTPVITTFTPASPIALHFGQINNLAQEDENLPIYLKFTITLKPNTDNEVILQYGYDEASVGGQYVSLYTMDLSSASSTGSVVTDTALMESLNDISVYPFLRFHYFVSDKNYTFTAGTPELTAVSDGSGTTVDFVSLFDSATEYLVENSSTHSVTFENGSDSAKTTYIYVKINVRSDTLADALESDMKRYIPAYLLFSIMLGVEIRTTASDS